MGKNNGSWKLLEIEHTADAAIRVSAGSLELLFQASAAGLYSVAGVQYDTSGKKFKKELSFSEADHETLLVIFLTELVFLLERGIYIKESNLVISGNKLEGTLTGFPILSFEREIKAVTFDNLKINNANSIFSAQIVFDI